MPGMSVISAIHFAQDMLVELNVSTPESGGSLRLRMRSCVVAVLAEGWALTAHRDSREASQGMQRRSVSCGSRFCSLLRLCLIFI